MFFLTPDIIFPPTIHADEDGLLCIGGDLSSERLLMAYRKGIFPWYSKEEPILWYSPDPRFVLFPEKLIISKSMKKVLQRNEFSVTINGAFNEVIHQCSVQKRKGQSGTWIHEEMIEAYSTLHQLGHAMSVECWKHDQLVGGLYGILLDNVFCGESMFSLESNASKFAFIHLVRYLQQSGIRLIDCQVYTSHLESLGAEHISRAAFETYLV